MPSILNVLLDEQLQLPTAAHGWVALEGRHILPNGSHWGCLRKLETAANTKLIRITGYPLHTPADKDRDGDCEQERTIE